MNRSKLFILSSAVLLVSVGGFIGVVLGITTHPTSHAETCLGSADGSTQCAKQDGSGTIETTPAPTQAQATQAPQPTAPAVNTPIPTQTIANTQPQQSQTTSSSPPPSPCH